MPEAVALLGEEAVRHLDQDAGAVAGVLLAAAGAAVLEVQEDLEPLLDDACDLRPFDVDHEADAAGVVLVLRVVKTLRRGRRHCRSIFHDNNFQKLRDGSHCSMV